MKFEYIGDGTLNVIDKSGLVTEIEVDDVDPEQWAAILSDYYRMGFVDGVNIMAEAAKGACCANRPDAETVHTNMETSK